METLEKLQAEKSLIQTKIDELKAIDKMTKAEVKSKIEAKESELALARVDFRIKKDSFDAIKVTVNSLNSEIETLKLKLKK